MKFIFASHNPNKTKEIRALLPVAQIDSLADLEYHDDIPETGASLDENAAIKARTIYTVFKRPVFADDTGLIVPALKGEPGVYSARYAGPQAKAADNMQKLLANMKAIQERSAYFETSICYIDAEGMEFVFRGRVEGEILKEPRGAGGFGYDPVFLPLGEKESFAEMEAMKKNRMSHRGRALEAFIRFLQAK